MFVKKIRRMSALFSELVTDILLRLPVSSLLRFRCLSTSLCAEIDSGNFIKNHLNRSIQRKIRQKLIVYNQRSGNPTNFYYADFDDDLVNAFPLNKPLICRDRDTSVCCSDNGLILLVMDSEVKNGSLDIVVWNPFTRRYKILPPCPVRTLPGYRFFVGSGLAYDSVNDDYKIVTNSRVADSCQMWVFSLKSDFWRRSIDLENGVLRFGRHFANGAFYWECRSKQNFYGFDLAKEVLFDIPQLSSAFLNPLVVFGGNLYFGTMDYRTVEYYLLVSDVNHGEVVGFSWRKELTMENVEPDRPGFEYDKVYAPPLLAYSKDRGSILLEEGNGIFWHNLENKTKQKVNFAGLPELCYCRHDVCWESLVSVGKDSAFDGAAEDLIID